MKPVFINETYTRGNLLLANEISEILKKLRSEINATPEQLEELNRAIMAAVQINDESWRLIEIANEDIHHSDKPAAEWINPLITFYGELIRHTDRMIIDMDEYSNHLDNVSESEPYYKEQRKAGNILGNTTGRLIHVIRELDDTKTDLLKQL